MRRALLLPDDRLGVGPCRGCLDLRALTADLGCLGLERPIGTTVVIDSFSEAPTGLLGDAVVSKLTTALALALAAFDAQVAYDANTLDPTVFNFVRRTIQFNIHELCGIHRWLISARVRYASGGNLFSTCILRSSA